MSEIKIMSLNCRGLGNLQKRKDVFNYLHSKQYSIYCLQDTHFTGADRNTIRSSWGYEAFFSPGRSDARGVAILFKNNFDFEVLESRCDDIGNLMSLKIIINKNHSLLLINIYGPNRDNPEFYKHIESIVDQNDSDFVVIVGDYNLVLNPEVDYRNYRAVNNPRARQAVLEFKEKHNLEDAWRIHHQDTHQYTWFCSNPVKKARLDFFLVSTELMAFVEKTSIKPGYRTDHSIIDITLKFDNFKRQKGFWKFNNSLLWDKQYIEKVKISIEETKQQYAAFPYEPDAIHTIKPEEIEFIIDDQIFFELLLLNIRGITIAYSSARKKEKDSRERFLEKEIEKLETSNLESQNILLFQYKEELEELRKEKIKGLFIRTKLKWIEEGEKPSKYFCSLEKRNFVNKTVTKLTDKKGNIIQKQDEILSQIEQFYKNLYECKDNHLDEVNLCNLIPYDNIPKLDDEMNKKLEGPITWEESSKALKAMKNDKSPGSDGFTAEFFKFFWKDIGYFLLRSINKAFFHGQLSLTQRQGIITILPKLGKQREFLKNWRPISLLNVSYKILSACLANRIKQVMSHLIHNDQKGFIPGRYIGENTRLTYDILHECKAKNIPGLLLLIDFEKAFDTISWKFMNKVLDFFKFGQNFKQWINIINSDIKLCVIQNGIFSSFFEIGRGCRQGDPVSPYLFNLCVEILGIMIRYNTNIKGIKLYNKEYRISQYADDTTLYLDGSEKSLKSVLDLLYQFAKYSGLKPNIDKTRAIWIGTKINSNDIICADMNLNWSKDPFDILGIKFTADLEGMEIMNYSAKLNKVRKEINSWNKRNLTPLGKITVIKSILLPKFTHLFLTIPVPSDKFLKDLESMLYKFLWNNKPDKISRKLIAQDYNQGGLRMIHIENFVKGLKITWIRRMIQTSNEVDWISLFENTHETSLNLILKRGDSYTYDLSKKSNNKFWKETLLFTSQLHSILLNRIKEINDLTNTPIWLNSHIKIDGKPILYRTWNVKGIYCIQDLFNIEGAMLSYEQFCNKYDFRTPFTLFMGIKLAILNTWPILKDSPIDPFTPNQPVLANILTKDQRGSRTLYDIFMSEINCEKKYELKWKISLNIDENICWKQIYISNHEFSRESRLLWFQYRVVHRILATNKLLHNIKLVRNPLCTFCQQEIESLEHLFYYCELVTNLWRNLETIIRTKCRMEVEFSAKTVFLLYDKKRYMNLNLIIVLTKLYIYKKRFTDKRLQINELKQDIKYYIDLEKYKYRIQGNYKTFVQKWIPLIDAFG